MTKLKRRFLAIALFATFGSLFDVCLGGPHPQFDSGTQHD